MKFSLLFATLCLFLKFSPIVSERFLSFSEVEVSEFLFSEAEIAVDDDADTDVELSTAFLVMPSEIEDSLSVEEYLEYTGESEFEDSEEWSTDCDGEEEEEEKPGTPGTCKLKTYCQRVYVPRIGWRTIYKTQLVCY